MSTILKQRFYFVTKRFEITSNSLKMDIKNPLNYIEDEFAFEEISKKLTRRKSPNLFTVVPGLACLVATFITTYSHFYQKDGNSVADIMMYAVPGAVLLMISAFNFKNIINLMLHDKRTVPFYADSPTKTEVDDFLAQILAEQKKYMLARYAKADPYLSVEQSSNNLQWLRDRNIINDFELEELRIKILPKPGNSSVGFKFKPGSN